MKIIPSMLFALLPLLAAAQVSSSGYSPAQRAALQSYLSKNTSYGFIPETWFDAQSLKYVRTQMGLSKSHMPYFQSGDFNRDGIKDFVVYVAEKEPRGSDPRAQVVIFNGVKGNRFRVAHVEEEPFTDHTFLQLANGRPAVVVFETEDAGCFVPAGAGYIVEPCQ